MYERTLKYIYRCALKMGVNKIKIPSKKQLLFIQFQLLETLRSKSFLSLTNENYQNKCILLVPACMYTNPSTHVPQNVNNV